MRRLRTLTLLPLLVLPACGLVDLFGGDESEGDPPPPWSTSQGSAPTTGWDPTEGGWVTETAGPTATTEIEMTGADNDPELGCPCAKGTELVYVLSDTGALWSFDPTDLSFEFIGGIACGGMSDTFSMGVSRKGRAWVQYFGGDLYTVDLNDPGDPIPCKDPGFSPGHPLFPNFGMAFVANSLSDPCDKLYAHSGLGPEVLGPDVGALGVIDPLTLQLSVVAPIDYGWGELTGTATGRLFAFAGTAPALLIEYDKDTGEELDVLPLPGLKSDSAFAFAWWGGDFYLFSAPDEFALVSQVWHLDYDESDGAGQHLGLVGEAPVRIVGAGVSTCAPPDPM